METKVNQSISKQQVNKITLSETEKTLLRSLEELVNSVQPHFTQMGVKKAFSQLVAIESAKSIINKTKLKAIN